LTPKTCNCLWEC